VTPAPLAAHGTPGTQPALGGHSATGIGHQPGPVQGAALGEAGADWRELLRAELVSSIRSGQDDGQLFDRLSAEFERVVYGTALEKTRGKRLEAASLLGVGRNTITRKIQELSLE
jgi:two-component system nitrogen regulation response regulator GlnG